jgi:HEAT repeat protein
MLIDIYRNLTFGLVQRIRHGAGKDVEDARAALARVGQRAVKPLLDALADGDTEQQRVAIDVLGYVENKNAGPALFAFATGPAEMPLRVRAMIACGAPKDPALLPRYDAFLFPKDGHAEDGLNSDAVTTAASWGVARMGDRRAVPILRALARRGTPEVRALAVLGLGLAHDRGALPEVVRVATAVDSGNVARAAAAYALGDLAADAEVPTLLSLAQGTDALPRQMALLSLARLHVGTGPQARAAVAAMADALFAGGDAESARSRATGEALQRTGAAALALLAGPSPKDAHAVIEPLPVPDGGLDVEATLEQLVPQSFTEKERAAALLAYGDAVQRAALAALTTASDRARSVLDALGGGDGALAPFVGAVLPPAPPSLAQTKAREIARALEPSVVALARHPDASIRTKAVVLLARSSSDAATAAVVLATGDTNETVQRVALSAIGAQRDPRAVAAVGKVLEQTEAWALRVLAAQAMGRLGAAGAPGSDAAEAAQHLRRAATKDTYALVREAALKALATFDPRAARDLAETIERSDPEPRVRDAAHAIAVH